MKNELKTGLHFCIIKSRKFISSYPNLIITVPRLFLLMIKIIMLIWRSSVSVGCTVGNREAAGRANLYLYCYWHSTARAASVSLISCSTDLQMVTV